MSLYVTLKQSPLSLTRFHVGESGGLTLQVLRVAQEIALEPDEAAQVRLALLTQYSEADALPATDQDCDAPIPYAIADDNPFLRLDAGEPLQEPTTAHNSPLFITDCRCPDCVNLAKSFDRLRRGAKALGEDEGAYTELRDHQNGTPPRGER